MIAEGILDGSKMQSVREFESTDLKVLMQIYHEKKKDSIASTCAFLVKLSNMPEEKNGNPAYILQHFGLWDNSELGLTMTIPSELLDRSYVLCFVANSNKIFRDR